MTDMFTFGDGELTDDLQSLDEELSAIRYEERPSFGPELRAELAQAWADGSQRHRVPIRRYAAAAVVAAILVGGAAVPSARASFVRLIDAFSPEIDAVEAPTVGAAPVRPVPLERTLPPPSPVVAVASEKPEPEPAPKPETETEVVVESVIIAPEIIDRADAERLLEDAYPRHLQRQGIGGTVWLRLWVGPDGTTGDAEVSRSSGVTDLDRAAIEVAPRLMFVPALQDGRRMGTWIEFPVRFEPDADLIDRVLLPVIDPFSLPTVRRDEWWQMSEPLDLDEVVASPEHALEPGVLAGAEQALAEAIDDASVIREFGPASAILAGEAPAGMGPTRWRAAVGAALEASIDEGSENPAALLALGRIRLRQGLRTEARGLFERGLQMAVVDGAQVSAWVTAELHYERGLLVRDSWLASDGVGRVRAQAFRAARCAQASSTGGGESGHASVERLIAWNYLCPRELSNVFATGFEPISLGSAGDLTLMMASLRAAIQAYPAHVGANTNLLITLAGEGRWADVLSGARRFARVSGGHHDALLLVGLALHRLGRTEEAAEHFRVALARAPEAEAD